jgi:hypothetical protein
MQKKILWFSKNKWSNQKFREIYTWRQTPRRQVPAAMSHGGSIPAAMPHDVKSLPLWGTAAGEHFWWQDRAARSQDPAA